MFNASTLAAGLFLSLFAGSAFGQPQSISDFSGHWVLAEPPAGFDAAPALTGHIDLESMKLTVWVHPANDNMRIDTFRIREGCLWPCRVMSTPSKDVLWDRNTLVFMFWGGHRESWGVEGYARDRLVITFSVWVEAEQNSRWYRAVYRR